ncbi:MAG: serine protease [Candidatus Pacebacteria bacterium]|nr:serine protease [Candidatus Paceibacterota bacterium]
MNLNELNPTQIILLTLLISFVTSIATGIVTVSLVNQAPPVVTDTIHKVYEKTIEKIVPGEQTATVIENNNTIIVSEEDFIIEAVNKNSESLVRIYTYVENKEEEEMVKEFVGVGLFMSEEGDIVAQRKDFIKEGLEEKDYFISFNEQEIKLILDNSAENDFIFLGLEELGESSTFSNIDMGDSDSLKLGQSIIVLGGEDTDMILTGIISNLVRNKIIINKTEEDVIDLKLSLEQEKIIVEKIETNLNPRNSMVALIDMDGKIIGIKLDGGIFTPINIIKETFDIKKSLATTEE